MNENEIVEAKEGFYRLCAHALGCEYDCNAFPYSRRTRWNNREPGSGRYEGHGIIRRYSSTHIQVSLHTPFVNGLFKSEKEVLEAITPLGPLGGKSKGD